jgi:hypothetical protein
MPEPRKTGAIAEIRRKSGTAAPTSKFVDADFVDDAVARSKQLNRNRLALAFDAKRRRQKQKAGQ